ncbi:hypothetical protein SK128_012190 [Halocaridina rubra]|uniref:Uncharacterized protein n=1 Tax=Halocaridina rubra TaxID=373956 RepID=A0AAN8XUM4_HALRR
MCLNNFKHCFIKLFQADKAGQSRFRNYCPLGHSLDALCHCSSVGDLQSTSFNHPLRFHDTCALLQDCSLPGSLCLRSLSPSFQGKGRTEILCYCIVDQ